MNKIVYSNLTFLESDILSGHYILEHAMSGEKLSYDSMTFTILSQNPKVNLGSTFQTSNAEDFITSDGNTFVCLSGVPFTEFIPGTPIYFYQDDVLVNKFYLSDVKRVGKDSYKFECESAIGLLGKSSHAGGIYNGTLISTVLNELLIGIDYELNPIAQNIKLYGWLPYATKRDNLQQITLATALSLQVKSDGKLYFTALSSEVKSTIGNDKLVMGGRIETGTPCTALRVTEHQFIQDTTEITLCDESFFTTKLILFSEPVHSLVLTGGTMVYSSANHAVVTGAGTVLLKGKKYIHTTKQITKGTILGNSNDNILQITDATLVTSLNSNAVANKLYDALTKSSKIVSQVIRTNEKPGEVVEVLNPYTEEISSGFLLKMSADITRSPLTDMEVLVGYTPSGAITGYQNRVVLTTGSSWTVPVGVTEIRAVLIGGGHGGQAGSNGASGWRGNKFPNLGRGIDSDDFGAYLASSNGNGGEGGLAGVGGEGGKIVDTGALNVSAGNAIAYTLGTAGTGGASNGEVGTSGTETVFGEYSTTNGQATNSGYVDIATSSTYASKGSSGYDGGKGSGGDNLPPSLRTAFPQSYPTKYPPFFSKTRYCGAVPFPEWGWYWFGSPKVYLYAIAGSGGGSSYTSNGGIGTSGDCSENNGKGFADGGNGGNGANAGLSSNSTIFGGGGHGGHGGGGGGGGGASANYVSGDNYAWEGAGGLGGTGGPGGNGKQGCIIIYY